MDNLSRERPDLADQVKVGTIKSADASRALTEVTDSNGYEMNGMCVDAMGRRCHNGKDFMLARDEDAFPVRYFFDFRPETSFSARAA